MGERVPRGDGPADEAAGVPAAPPEAGSTGRPAVFLDRDGTVIDEHEYLADPEGVRLVPGAAGAVRRLHEAGLTVVIVTNQSGIARGLYTEADYHAVAARVQEILEERHASPDGTYYCPHHPDHTGPCDCRKPDTGMHRRAARELGIDLAASYYVGDKITDVLPAGELGGQGILVRTGYGEEWEDEVRDSVWVVSDVTEAVGRILEAQAARPEGADTGGEAASARGNREASSSVDPSEAPE